MAAECAAEGEHATGIMMLKQTETYVGAKTHLAIYEEHPDVRSPGPVFTSEPKDEADAGSSASWTTFPAATTPSPSLP